MKQPVIVSYGGGRDSTAMLVEMWKRGWRPDKILMGNVGSEKSATYEYLPIMNEWLINHDFPEITIVQYTPKSAPYRSIEGNLVLNATLAGATFNLSSCTMKFKVEPQAKWTRNWDIARQAWAAGVKVLKLIGFECDEGRRLKRADARAHSGKADKTEAARFEYQYPLMDWGYDLEKCKQIITDAGLPVPVKSACFMCPNQKPEEVHELTPNERARVILIEIVAEPYNKKVRGLWRQPRKADGRPGSITEYILQQKLPFTPLEQICKQVVLNPKCQKAEKNDGAFTFAPPHIGPTLRQLMTDAGHFVPEVILPGAEPAEGLMVYQEDWREAKVSCEGCGGCDMDVETDQHLEAVEAL